MDLSKTLDTGYYDLLIAKLGTYNDLFHLIGMTDVCNYANDTTFHACDLDLKSLITRLESDVALSIEWSERSI